MTNRNIGKGIESLEAFEPITILETLSPEEQNYGQIIKIRFHFQDLPPDSEIPNESDWYVLIDSVYPAGSIAIHPAKENGLTETYPHQRRNTSGDEAVPWRTGNICVERYESVLGRSGTTDEPSKAETRLRWYIDRTYVWLQLAANQELRQPGDPYEVPEFDTSDSASYQLAFNESIESFDQWERLTPSWGTTTLLELSQPTGTLVPIEFATQSGDSVYEPEWGTFIRDSNADEVVAPWILLDDPPFKAPWSAPETWRELEEFFQDIPVDLHSAIAGTIFEHDAQRSFLLLGFPIPERVDESPAIIHWKGVQLPDLGSVEDRDGFRQSARSERYVSQMELPHYDLQWLSSDNWSHEQLSRRGSFKDAVARSEILLIGAGALGGAVAECLVRGGVRDLTIIDGEKFEIGNIARHTLSVEDVGRSKADALAERISLISPSVRVDSISESFPPNNSTPEAVASADFVIDCTGSETVLEELSRYPWQKATYFCSASLGRRGKRLFFFSAYSESFPRDVFDAEIREWMLKEGLEGTDTDAIPERVGCWHPASVIRMDQISTWAGTVSKLAEEISELRLGETNFVTLEGTGDCDNELPTISEPTPPFEDAAKWISPESPISIRLQQGCIDELQRLCGEADDLETGGILVGKRLSGTDAVIVSVSDPPPDSTQRPRSLTRGTEGIDEWLAKQREEHGIRYLGEWHYHPFESPDTSPCDRSTMFDIAANEEYGRPDPILFVIGGTPPDDFSVNVYVFHREGDFEQLQCVNPEHEPEDNQ